MILDKSIYLTRKPKPKNFDTRTSIRMKEAELNEFKDFYGVKWQDRVRALMIEDVKKQKAIKASEEAKRAKYLNTNKYDF